MPPPPVWSPEGLHDFTFTERSGKTITKQDLLGQPWVIGFVFTRCAGPCPQVMGQMRKLQDALPDTKFRLVTLTVDPEYDTPERLQQFADFFGADPDKWLLLTGDDKNAIYRMIGEEFKLPVEEVTGADRKPGYEFLHSTNLMLVDKQGVVQGKFNALRPEEMAKLRREVERLAR